jgi:hypothetical protein
VVACSVAIALTPAGVTGCGTATSGAHGPTPRPSSAAADAAYYRERVIAVEAEAVDEIARTDWGRFRRGRLYAGEGAPQGLERSLNEELSAAFEGGRSPAVVDVTTRILAHDPTDIRAHMFRGMALRKLERSQEAEFHRRVAIALLNSIVGGGDGKSADSAWTVYQVKEEYEVIKTLGGLVESQSLASKGGKMLDVLEARRPAGGKPFRVYFDITELFAEGERRMRRRD